MKIISFACLFSMLAFAGYTQNLSPQARRTPLVSDLFNGLPIAKPAPGIEGDVYNDGHWNLVAFTLYTSAEPIEGYYARYNIHANEFEVRTQQGVKGLNGDRVKSYVMKDTLIGTVHSYRNARDFTLDGTPLSGFFELLSAGPAQLAKRYYLIVKNPDYNPALSAGSRNTKIIKKSELYYLMGQQAYKIKGKKKLLASFGDKAEQMDTYIQANALSLSEEEGLRKVFDHYNTLIR